MFEPLTVPLRPRDILGEPNPINEFPPISILWRGGAHQLRLLNHGGYDREHGRPAVFGMQLPCGRYIYGTAKDVARMSGMDPVWIFDGYCDCRYTREVLHLTDDQDRLVEPGNTHFITNASSYRAFHG